MKLSQSNHTLWVSAVLSIILYGASMALVHWDSAFTYRWVAFWLHTCAVGVVVGAYLMHVLRQYSIKKMFAPAELVPFVVIVLVTEVANFLYLSSYQFVSISDELRDGGLFALKIANGSIKNIFGYGSYEAHGLTIPIFTRFFYAIFGSSVLTYRVASAILASVAVLLVYILVRKVLNKSTAFWTCFVLATMPLHMFFAHSQAVIGFNLLLVPVLLLGYYALLKKHGYQEYIVLGSLIGFSAGFHASIRAFGCFVLALVVIEDVYQVFKKWPLDRKKIFKWLGKSILLAVFAFVGFGPRLLFTDATKFFHTRRLPVEYKIEDRRDVTPVRLIDVRDKYIKSLMVYIYEPTVFFYPVQKPMFPPFIAVFFMLGVGYSFFVLKNQFVHRLLGIAGGLPFFISAITDVVNADHRVSTLLAIGTVFVGIGIVFSLNAIRHVVWKYVLGISIAVFLLWQGAMYYIDQPANQRSDLKNYVHMHALMKMQELTHAPTGLLSGGKSTSSAKFCLRVSTTNYENYTVDWGHDEQVEYFLPGTKVKYLGDSSVGDNEIYIDRGACLSGYGTKKYKLKVIDCAVPGSYVCPINYRGEMRMYFE